MEANKSWSGYPVTLRGLNFGKVLSYFYTIPALYKLLIVSTVWVKISNSYPQRSELAYCVDLYLYFYLYKCLFDCGSSDTTDISYLVRCSRYHRQHVLSP
jgi:hypothetical protein